jgi:hypothetical protein
MRIHSRVATIVGAAAMAAGGLAVTAPAADAASRCNVGNINNGWVWSAAVGSKGYAQFHEYGDRLVVKDKVSDGKRTVAQVKICGGERIWEYDSGRDEGSTDTESYGLDFDEGLKFKFRACVGSNCSPWKSVNT